MFVYNYLATQTNILFSGGNYMKIKIVNKNKFIRTCVIIFISVICMIFFGFNNAYSKENIKYKTKIEVYRPVVAPISKIKNNNPFTLIYSE